MALRRVIVGLAGVLMAGTALAQTIIPQNIERATNTNVQPYAPLDARQAPAQPFSPQQFFGAQRGGQPGADTRANWADHRAQGEMQPAPVQEMRQDPRFDPRTDPRADPRTDPRADPRTDPRADYRPEYRTQDARQPDSRYTPQQQPVMDYRQPRERAGQPPVYGPGATQPVLQPNVQPAAAQPIYDQRPPIHRPADALRPAGTDRNPAVQDFRNPAGAARPLPAVAEPPRERLVQPPVYEARPGVIDPRVVVPRKEEYIDYKVPEGRAYDFRPLDYKPVDSRSLEYRSQDNRVPDQKVLDPRLKEKGPEIQAVLDCKAIMYRAVECNFLDYREVDPKLQALFAKYPEVAFGIVPKEYSKDLVERWQPLLQHLSAQIGLKLSLKVANDYQALMESQRAGLVHIAIYSPVAYARARHAGVKIDAFAVEANRDGAKGGYSLVYSLGREAARPGTAARGDDVRGKSIAMVDPNSVTGYFMPRLMAAAQKADPDQFWAKQVFAGSHENALAALSQGLVELAVGHWNSEEDSSLSRALARGLLRHPDGSPMRRDDFRVVMKSEMMANAPIAYLSEMPEDLKGLIRRALLEAPMRDRTAFDKIYDGKAGWEGIEPKAYDGAVDLVKFMDDSRQRDLSRPSRQQAAR